jgi:enterochelin esterase family protein
MESKVQQAKHLCSFLSHIDQEHRHRDFVCSDDYSKFLIEELMPELRGQNLLGEEPPILVGLSLSGLAALHAGCYNPDVFSGILAQSPSAWWNDEWLVRELETHPARFPRTWLSVGLQETDEDVIHPPSGMHQKTSQWASCHRLVHALQATQTVSHLHEYQGGHDPACWREELNEALQWLLR